MEKFKSIWSKSIRPVYDAGFEHISRPLLVKDGLVMLDGASLIKIDFAGNEIWRHTDDYGYWGHPTYLARTEQIICASLDNAVCWIDKNGQLDAKVELSSPVESYLLSDEAGNLWFIVGRSMAFMIHIDSTGKLIYKKPLDYHLQIHPQLTFDSQGNIWITTQREIVKVQKSSGEILAKLFLKGVDDYFPLSSIYCKSDKLFVVIGLRDNVQGLLIIDGNSQEFLPLLTHQVQEAHLISAQDDGLWIVGTACSPWDLFSPEDKTIVAKFNQGKLATVNELIGHRSLSISTGNFGQLWLGGYTSDSSESGSLHVFNSFGHQIDVWRPEPPKGVGSVIFSEKGYFVTTSNALVKFEV